MQSILKTNTRHIFSSIVYVQRSLSTHLNTPWRTAYGGKYTVTLIHGDGVGPELMEHVKATIRCVRAPIDFEDIPLTSHVASDEMFERAVMAVKRNGVALKGNLASQNTTNSLNVLLRTRLNLFANVKQSFNFNFTIRFEIVNKILNVLTGMLTIFKSSLAVYLNEQMRSNSSLFSSVVNLLV
ncbi:unnamed protein product [Rotaria socialis]